jgi:two-component system nitrate/nitrite response regulator NarL
VFDALQTEKRTPEPKPAKSILIVDDSHSVRFALRTAIETFTNFQVCGEASQGAEAVEKGTQLNPDLVIMDLAMPMMNGVEAASLLKKKLPEVLIVLFTVYAHDVHLPLSPPFGVTMVLPKTDGFTPLLDCLNGLLGSA